MNIVQTFARCQTLPCANFCTPPKSYPVENFPHPYLYNLKAKILKDINILDEIAIKGLLVLNFAPAAQENFPEQVAKVTCLNSSCGVLCLVL